jgi:hypothetical protein
MGIMKTNDMPALRMNYTPLLVKRRGSYSQDFPMRLAQRCGCVVKDIAIDNQGLIKIEMKSFGTDDDLRGIIAKLSTFKAFNCLDRIYSLKMSSSFLTGEGLKLLPVFRNMKELDISCAWRIKGNEFSELGRIKTLERLDISNNYLIGKDGIEEIMFISEMPVLKHVNLKMTNVGIGDRWDNFKRELQKKNPELEILCIKDPFEA